MQLGQVETFLAVARGGGVTAAATRLGKAPSSVSAQIRALERSLDVALFDRTAAGLVLTEAGTRLLPWARRLLDDVDLARREVAGLPSPLRLGTLDTLAATHVPAVLARIAELAPELAVTVAASGRRDGLLADVASGALDAALLLDHGETLGALGFPAPGGPDVRGPDVRGPDVRGPDVRGPDVRGPDVCDLDFCDLDFCDLDEVPTVLVVAPGDPLLDRRRVTPDDLRDRPLIVSPPGCSFRYALDLLVGDTSRRTEQPNIAVVAAWARHGLGAALLPEFAIAAERCAGDLVPVDLAEPAPTLALRVVWRADREDRSLRSMLYAVASASGPGARPGRGDRASAPG